MVVKEVWMEGMNVVKEGWMEGRKAVKEDGEGRR